MIPIHLEGKSGVEICVDMKARFYLENKSLLHEEIIGKDSAINFNDAYMRHLESLLLLSVEDALINAEEVKELIQEGEYKAMLRVIGFLHKVLPRE